jgi:hypothetical protein
VFDDGGLEGRDAMLIYQRRTFADDFLLHVLLPYLPARATRFLGFLGIWGRPIRPPGPRSSDKQARPMLVLSQLARLVRRPPPVA